MSKAVEIFISFLFFNLSLHQHGNFFFVKRTTINGYHQIGVSFSVRVCSFTIFMGGLVTWWVERATLGQKVMALTHAPTPYRLGRCQYNETG